jgi:high-affinity iron transporter
VPVEYGRGVKDDRVTKDFEIQEAIAFGTAADAAFDDLRDQLAKRDTAATDAIGVEIDRLSAVATGRREQEDRRRVPRRRRDARQEIEDQLATSCRPSGRSPTDDSDYDLIALTLDRMEAAVGAGQRRQAEQARLEAYAFFEFGPERR